MLTFLGIAAAAVAFILAAAYFVPLPVAYNQDFSVMYFTNKGLINGIPIYTYPAQLEYVKSLTRPDFTFFPFPYPPWYSLATIYIGLLPLQVAARAWFFMNIGMISLSVWLLTPGWKVIARILAAFAAIMFIPAFGLLMVGQYTAPVLLGSALFVFAARQRSSFLAALALILMTFKPHIGAILFLAGFAWLIFERSTFSRRALSFTILGGLLVAGLGFFADPAWPLMYFQSLARYRDIPGVQTCGLCASLPVALLKLFTGQSSTLAAVAPGLILALALAALLFWRYRRQPLDAALLVSLAAVTTLLVDPYLLNYDYLLLLVPLIWLVQHERLAVVPYLIPWAALTLGRDGNMLLALAGIMTFILILRRPIDSPAAQAYNQSTIE